MSTTERDYRTFSVGDSVIFNLDGSFNTLYDAYPCVVTKDVSYEYIYPVYELEGDDVEILRRMVNDTITSAPVGKVRFKCAASFMDLDEGYIADETNISLGGLV